MAPKPALALQTRTAFPSTVELRQSLPSTVAGISPFVDQLIKFITKLRGCDGTEVDIEIALREALINAVVHGNHENPAARVQVACRCSMGGEVSITVRDQGQGFDNRAVADPTSPDNLLSLSGRGICLMQSFMDEVRFEEGGTVVTMRKKARAA
jgi:serine/threonine-protein kinase RsbW